MLFAAHREKGKGSESETMAACGSLEHIFEKPLPETPSFLESLSPWKRISHPSTKPVDDASFTDIFGELHFRENPIHPSTGSSSSSSSDEKNGSSSSYHPSSRRKHSDSFSSMNSESLSLCTEGLGSESFDDVEDSLKHDACSKELERQDCERSLARNSQAEQHHRSESKVSARASTRGEFPPPISCIGRSGKPWVCFKSYREDGRFILKEIRIPTQEFLHACREDGRLKLRLVQSDDEVADEDEDEDEDNNGEDMEEHNGVNEQQQNVEIRDCNS